MSVSITYTNFGYTLLVWLGQGFCILEWRKPEHWEDSLRVPTVVAEAGSDGVITSAPEQPDSRIPQGGHDLWPSITMDAALILRQRHIFDIVQPIFNAPMATL